MEHGKLDLQGCALSSILLALFLLPTPAHAQAWTQPKHHGYFKLTYGQSAAAEQYTTGGDLQPYARNVEGDAFLDRSYYLYAEFGLTDQATLVALLPYKQLTVRDGTRAHTTRAPGSAQLGLRVDLKPSYKARGTPHAVAAQFLLTLPTGYARNRTPAAGPGQVDVQGTLHYGASLWPLPAYTQVGLGLRLRSGLYALSHAVDCDPHLGVDCLPDQQPVYDEEWLFSGEIGASAGRWALVQILAFGVWSNQAPVLDFDPANPIPTRQRYLKAGAGLTLYPVPAVGLSVQYFTTPAGRNTVRSSDWFWGLEYKLR